MEGYIKMYRQLMESQVFANQTALKIWIWCLLKASHKERFVSLKTGKGNRTIKILPGQFIFGRLKAEEELNIDGSTIYRWINKFKSKDFGMIFIDANNQYSIISISNWGNYQSEKSEGEQPMSNQRTRHEPDMNTDKTVNTVKNVKEINSAIEFYPFSDFWNDYDKKIDSKKCQEKWSSISDSNRKLIKEHLPNYKKSTPDIKYRKNPATFLNGKCWNDAIIYQKNDANQFPDRPPKPSPYHNDWNSEKGEWMYSPTNR